MQVIEVAKSSPDRDIRIKAPLYAQAGIPAYWVADVQRRVHRFTNPTPNGYATEESYEAGAAVPLTWQGETIGHVAVDAMIPPPEQN